MDLRSQFLANLHPNNPSGVRFQESTHNRSTSHVSYADSSSSTLIPETWNSDQRAQSENISGATVPLIQSKSARQSKFHATIKEKGSTTEYLGGHEGSKKLHRNYCHLSLTTFLDVVLALFATAFFIFGLLVLHFRDAPVKTNASMANTLINAAKLGPTIFPILFASALSRSLHIIMLKMLERGSRLGTLNLLAGSTSVAGTILHQAALRLPSLLGLALIVAWALSPLGGQASLRVVSIGTSSISSTIDTSYMSTNKSFDGYVTGDLGQMQTMINGLFNAALLGPERTKASPVDTWSNVKVPQLEALSNDENAMLHHTWIDVPAENVTYSSLIGLPVTEFPSTSESTFTLETSYFVLDCPLLSNNTYPQHWGNASNGTYGDGFTGVTPASAGMGGTMLSNSTKCRGSPDDAALPPRYIAWNSFDDDGRVSALCTVWMTYVEVEIECKGASCAATRIRNSTLPHPSRAWTWLDGPSGACNWWLYYFQYFLATVVINRSGTSTPLEGYLMEPDAPASPNMQSSLTHLDHKVFATRFAQLMNSFWIICAGPYAVAYGFDGEATNLNNNGTGVASTWQTLYNSEQANTKAQSVNTFKVIECHAGWLVALLLASLLLVVACIAGIILRFKLTTPELMLNWTTVVRDNPYIAHQISDSRVEDIQRSRLLRHARIRFGDVEPASEIGHLAIASVSDDNAVSRATRDRAYD
ncbi:hypothetical protein HII31_04785 [Pseudocercospora fuligena]|uniref:Uncharacterized protein n=1 Tax=Pseudocercospora fuligena TaxID=685502 RepID=A0A8H6VP80_9PEZI|nr:hypothetical protein HII31_04785 [Pseudocercospora fuligena]